MDLMWDVAAVPGLVSGLLSVTLAGFVYLSRPTRTQNRFLAVFLFSTGLAWFGHKGLAPLLTDPGDARAGLFAFLFIHWIAHLFHFLFVTTLDSPLTRPLRRAWIRWTAVLLMGGAALSTIWVDDWAGPVVPSFVHGGWWGTPGPLYALAAPIFILLFLYGFSAGLSAWRASGTESERRQNRAYFLAFAVHDGGLALMLLLAATGGGWFGPFLLEHLFHWIPPLVNIWMVVLLSYGILTTQLFDIDVKVRIAVSRSTVAAAFAVVFLVVSETAEQLLDVDGTLAGIAAALMVAMAIRPLRRMAEQIAVRILPVAEDEHTHLMLRRLDVYRAAVEGAVQDGEITDRERGMLTRLADRLGLGDEEVLTLEAETIAHLAPPSEGP